MADVVYLDDADESDIHRYSSINQYGAFLSVKKGGVEIPLRFDKIDWIDCGKLKTHPVIISDGTDIGFDFPVGHYTYFTNTYYIMDRKEVVVKELPEWFGKGWYEKALNERVFTNFDGHSLGETNQVNLRIGYDYVKSDDVLDSSDEA